MGAENQPIIIYDGERFNSKQGTDFAVKEKKEILKGVIVSNSDVSVNDKKVIIRINNAGKVKINDKEFNVKYDTTNKRGARFVFDEKNGLSDGTNFIVGKNGGKFILKGIEWNLPEDSNVLFENGKVSILIPDWAKISDGKIVDEKTAKDSEFEFSSVKENGKIKLPDSLGNFKDNEFSGILRYKNGNYFVSDEKSKIDGFSIINEKKQEIYLFGDGKEHSESKGSYVSVGSEMYIKKIENGAVPKIKFESGNDFFKSVNEKNNLILQAGKSKDDLGEEATGLIRITKENDKNPGKIETLGDFRIYDGEKVYRSYLDNGKRDILVNNVEEYKGKTTYALEFIPYQEVGNTLIKDKNGKDIKILLKTDGNPEISLVPIDYKYELKEEIKTETKKDKSRVEMFASSVSLPVPPANTPENEQSTGNPGNKLITRNIKDNYNPNQGIANEIRSLTSFRYGNGDVAIDIHEEAHVLNGELSGKYNQMGYSNFYIGNNELVLVKNTGIAKSEASEYVPDSLRDSHYSLMFGNYHTNKDLTHVFEDIYPYQFSLEASRDPSEAKYVVDTITYALAGGMALRDKNPDYWNSNEGRQFKEFLGRSINDGTRLVNIYRMDKFFNKLRNNNDAESLRKFTRDTFGERWTKNVLRF